MNVKRFLCFLSILCSVAVYSQKDTTDRDTQEIEEVIISSNPKQVVFEDSKFYILDFSVNEKGIFVLLKNLRNYFVYYLDDYMNIKARLKLDFKPQSIFIDCQNDIHILAKDFMYELGGDNEDLTITNRRTTKTYHEYYENCIAVSNQKFFVRNMENVNQTTLYYSVDKITTSYDLLYRIEDSILVLDRLGESREIKGKTHLAQLKTAEVNAENLQSSRDQFEQENFFKFVLSKPDYHPLFVRDDTTYVFDHITGNVIQFSDSGKLLARIPIDYHLNKDWAKSNHFDSERNNFYTVYERNGAQHFVRFQHGDFSLDRETKITNAYPEKMMVYDGYVYYTCKPHFDANLNKLYRHKLL